MRSEGAGGPFLGQGPYRNWGFGYLSNTSQGIVGKTFFAIAEHPGVVAFLEGGSQLGLRSAKKCMKL